MNQTHQKMGEVWPYCVSLDQRPSTRRRRRAPAAAPESNVHVVVHHVAGVKVREATAAEVSVKVRLHLKTGARIELPKPEPGKRAGIGGGGRKLDDVAFDEAFDVALPAGNPLKRSDTVVVNVKGKDILGDEPLGSLKLNVGELEQDGACAADGGIAKEWYKLRVAGGPPTGKVQLSVRIDGPLPPPS